MNTKPRLKEEEGGGTGENRLQYGEAKTTHMAGRKSERCQRGRGRQQDCICVLSLGCWQAEEGFCMAAELRCEWYFRKCLRQKQRKKTREAGPVSAGSRGWLGAGRWSQECGGGRGLEIYLGFRASLSLRSCTVDTRGLGGGCALCALVAGCGWVSSHSCDGQLPGAAALSWVFPIWKMSSFPQISMVWSASWRNLFQEERPTVDTGVGGTCVPGPCHGDKDSKTILDTVPGIVYCLSFSLDI